MGSTGYLSLFLPPFLCLEQLYMFVCFNGVEYDWNVEPVQISGLCQALNNILDGMAKKGLHVPVWLIPSSETDSWWLICISWAQQIESHA